MILRVQHFSLRRRHCNALLLLQTVPSADVFFSAMTLKLARRKNAYKAYLHHAFSEFSSPSHALIHLLVC
jgi:hypothetical protein